MKFFNSLVCKILLAGILAVLMLIPLGMISQQVDERKSRADKTAWDISKDWGMSQTVSGPRLHFQYEVSEKDSDGKTVVKKESRKVFPEDLKADASVSTQTLHRSIYDVTVYQTDMTLSGTLLIPDDLPLKAGSCRLELGVSDLRGIVGDARFRLGEEWYRFTDSESSELYKEMDLSGLAGAVPFEMQLCVKGSESLYFRPVGGMTEVSLSGDCPDPSFTGDFLPAEREVRDDGFSAKWLVSQINRGGPEESMFGVKLLHKVSQYQQTTRTLKYGILIILMVFVAGLFVELVGKRKINIVQYLVIGLSLVLFYALLLSFSELMAFWMAYTLAAVMTTGALLGYFRSILRDNTAYALVALVAVAYILSYVLVQMETYALLAGTLILFVILGVIMYLTRNLNQREQE